MGYGFSHEHKTSSIFQTIANENNYTLKHFLVMDIAFKERPVQLRSSVPSHGQQNTAHLQKESILLIQLVV
jgi:hypothetical protein